MLTEPEYLPSSLLEIIHQASNLSDVLFVLVTRNHFGVEVEPKPRNSNLEFKCILAAQRRAWPLEAIRDNQHTKFESKRRYKNDPLLFFKFYFQNRKRRSGASDPGRQQQAYSAESNFTVAPVISLSERTAAATVTRCQGCGAPRFATWAACCGPACQPAGECSSCNSDGRTQQWRLQNMKGNSGRKETRTNSDLDCRGPVLAAEFKSLISGDG